MALNRVILKKNQSFLLQPLVDCNFSEIKSTFFGIMLRLPDQLLMALLHGFCLLDRYLCLNLSFNPDTSKNHVMKNLLTLHESFFVNQRCNTEIKYQSRNQSSHTNCPSTFNTHEFIKCQQGVCSFQLFGNSFFLILLLYLPCCF